MKKIYLSILMTLCPLLPGMAQQLSQHGRDTFGQTGLRASAAQTPKPFLQEGKEWYTRCVHYFLGESFHTERIEGDTILDGVAYKKMYDENVVEGFLREENGKVLGKKRVPTTTTTPPTGVIISFMIFPLVKETRPCFTMISASM